MIQGGVEKHCESLYPLFDESIDFVVFRRKPYVNSSITYSNIRFIDLPSTKIKGVETIFHSFLATIASIFHKPDIVHIHNIGPALFSTLLLLFGIKIVLTYHSPNYEHDKWGILAKCLLRFSEKIAISASSAILFVNKFQMEKMRQSFVSIRAKSYYVPNGIPAVIPTKNTDYIKSLGLFPEKYIIALFQPAGNPSVRTTGTGVVVPAKRNHHPRPRGSFSEKASVFSDEGFFNRNFEIRIRICWLLLLPRSPLQPQP